MKPWHLVMDFELVDPKGRPIQTGTIEELWASASRYKISYTTGKSNWTEISNQDGVFRSKGAEEPPEIASLLRRELIHPFPRQASDEKVGLVLGQAQIAGVAMNCIRLSQIPDPTDKPINSPIDPVYCLDKDNATLRVTTRYKYVNFTRGTIGTYVGKSVAIDQTISFGGVLGAKSHIAELRSEPIAADAFATDATLSAVTNFPLEIPSETIAPKWVKKVPPSMPGFAVQHHVGGTVLLRAFLGKDGQIVALKPVYAPSPDLSDASMSAVRQWVCKPYLVNGVPHEVATEIAVSFSYAY